MAASPTLDDDRTVSIPVLRQHLDAFQERLYPVWPVVHKATLLWDLEAKNDTEAYVLATALSAVTAAQLQLPPTDVGLGQQYWNSTELAAEAWRVRQSMDYLQNPSISSLLSSFFLHIAAANEGKILKAAFLLREAVTCAQLLGLDRAAYYRVLSQETKQLYLRIVWLLFITERYCPSTRSFAPVRLTKS